jgi:hypothetical protein
MGIFFDEWAEKIWQRWLNETQPSLHGKKIKEQAMTDGYKQPVSDWNFVNLDPTRPVSGFNNHKPSLAAEVDVVDSI